MTARRCANVLAGGQGVAARGIDRHRDRLSSAKQSPACMGGRSFLAASLIALRPLFWLRVTKDQGLVRVSG